MLRASLFKAFIFASLMLQLAFSASAHASQTRAAAGIGQSLYAGTLDGTTLSDEAQQRNAQLLGGIAAAFASGGDTAATMLASNIALSGMANNRQLHRDEVEWLRNNAQDFADQMGISYEEALAILIAAGTSLTDANPQIGGVDLNMLSTAAEWISDNAPVGMVVSGASGQEFFQSRDEVEYNNTFINVSDYFESGAHEALVAGGIVTRDSPLFDVMQASSDSRGQNADVRELIDIYYGGDTAAYFEDMTYGIAATVTSGVYNDPNFALATWSAAISDAQQAGVAIPPETMAYIRAASFATALGAGGLDRAGTSLIFDNLLRTMGIAPTPGLLTPSGGRRDTADEPIDIGGGGPGSGILPSPTTFNDLVSSSNLSGQTGSTRNFERSGGFAQANADFDALNPTNVRTISVSSGGTGRVGTLPDGRTVIVRETSQGANGQSGPPTVEVQGGTSGGLNARSKIRY